MDRSPVSRVRYDRSMRIWLRRSFPAALVVFLSLFASALCDATASDTASPAQSGATPTTVPGGAPTVGSCAQAKYDEWTKAQKPPPNTQQNIAKMIEFSRACSTAINGPDSPVNQMHQDLNDSCDISSDAAKGKSDGSNGPGTLRMPSLCETRVTPSGPARLWRAANNGIWDKNRPTDGRFRDGWLFIYLNPFPACILSKKTLRIPYVG